MHSNIDDLYYGLWQDYLSITPSAKKIHTLLGNTQHDGNSDNHIINDHVAFRTFAGDKLGLNKLAAHFLALGYEQKNHYDFASKKLNAYHFEHADEHQPKVFISELRVRELSQQAQSIIQQLIAQADSQLPKQAHFLYSGAPWQLSSIDYKILLEESEYAAWLAAWGFRANHFTVSVNHLSQYRELADVNNMLKQSGFTLNTSGGEIKGGADVFLAQSATMADNALVRFTDTNLHIPSCFYEFAQRFPLPNGKLYQGFVAASADKIFESTNAN